MSAVGDSALGTAVGRLAVEAPLGVSVLSGSDVGAGVPSAVGASVDAGAVGAELGGDDGAELGGDDGKLLGANDGAEDDGGTDGAEVDGGTDGAQVGFRETVGDGEGAP